jgi:hypothetical protein
MRTYSFDHFKADKPEPSTTNPGGAEQTPPVEQAKPRSDDGQLHYGRQHAQTAELYRKHREERERAEQMRVSEAQPEPEAAPREATEQQAARPPRQDMKEQSRAEQSRAEQSRAEQPQALEADEAEPTGLKGLAQQAVSSVLAAAKEAARGKPLSGARKLAGEAVSGARRVAQEVSARAGRSAKNEQKKEQEGGTKKKGPGKKR